MSRAGRDRAAGGARVFRLLYKHIAIGVAIVDHDSRFVMANPRFCEILGYPRRELRKLDLLAVMHLDDRATAQARLARLLAGRIAAFDLENRYVRKDGSEVWSHTTVATLPDRFTAPGHLTAVVQQIDGARAVDESRSRLAAIVESSDDAIISKTLDGIITSWNRGAERIFGYTPAEVIGKSITILIPPDHLDEEPAILERLKRGERIDHYETVRMRRDGTLLDVSLTVSPVRDGTGAVIGASKIARDISLQKHVEQDANNTARELATLNAALREADRRKDEFLATLAHELRNPLAPIRQAALVTGSPGATDAEKAWSHDVIARQVDHVSRLLDDLFDVARITRGSLELRPTITDLAAVVSNAVEAARPLIDEKKHSLAIELAPEPVSFAADSMRLAQVVANLLTNAAKYTGHGGTIRLRGSRVGDRVVVSVADNGIGIPAEALHEVFRMFSQVKVAQGRPGSGLGIGLALSKGIVELHGGTIRAASAGVGQGSEFTVELPILDVSLVQPVAVEPRRRGPQLKRRVLIADDNRDAAHSLAILLRMEGHEVTVVHDGDAAIAAFEAQLPEVVLLDIGMPKLDGYEVALQIRGLVRDRALLLIAITGWGQKGDKERAVAAGFDHHFTKPIHPDEIARLLQTERGC